MTSRGNAREALISVKGGVAVVSVACALLAGIKADAATPEQNQALAAQIDAGLANNPDHQHAEAVFSEGPWALVPIVGNIMGGEGIYYLAGNTWKKIVVEGGYMSVQQIAQLGRMPLDVAQKLRDQETAYFTEKKERK